MPHDCSKYFRKAREARPTIILWRSLIPTGNQSIYVATKTRFPQFTFLKIIHVHKSCQSWKQRDPNVNLYRRQQTRVWTPRTMPKKTDTTHGYKKRRPKQLSRYSPNRTAAFIDGEQRTSHAAAPRAITRSHKQSPVVYVLNMIRWQGRRGRQGLRGVRTAKGSSRRRSPSQSRWSRNRCWKCRGTFWGCRTNGTPNRKTMSKINDGGSTYHEGGGR